MNILCFGDSNTWGYDPRDRFGRPYENRWTDILARLTGHSVENQGANGREVPQESASIPEDTDLFLVMLGTNDLLQLDTPEAAAERMAVFLDVPEKDKLVLIAPPAMVPGEWVQDEELIRDSRHLAVLCRALAENLGIRFLDATQWQIPLSFDGVHFTEDAQQRFAECIRKELAL